MNISRRKTQDIDVSVVLLKDFVSDILSDKAWMINLIGD